MLSMLAQPLAKPVRLRFASLPAAMQRRRGCALKASHEGHIYIQRFSWEIEVPSRSCLSTRLSARSSVRPRAIAGVPPASHPLYSPASENSRCCRKLFSAAEPYAVASSNVGNPMFTLSFTSCRRCLIYHHVCPLTPLDPSSMVVTSNLQKSFGSTSSNGCHAQLHVQLHP